jgi:glucokinase
VIAEAGADRARLLGAGLGSPGPLSYSQGKLWNPGNLPGWEGFPLRDRLADRLGISVAMDNDANVAALGEYWLGAGLGTRNMVMFTLGTGVGSGVILEGRVYRGHFENAAELGHMIVMPGGRRCTCGQAGCLEAYSSAAAAAQLAAESAARNPDSIFATRLQNQSTLNSEDVVEACRAGDPAALEIWDTVGRMLGVACVNVQHAFNVEMVVLGGGMSAAGELLLECVRKHFRRLTWKLAADQPRIALAKLGNDAGIIGAARMAFQVFGKDT